MKYVSTRAKQAVTLSEAIRRGAAPDGGLYVPERLPRFEAGELPAGLPLPKLAERLLKPFFEGDALEAHLGDICANAFNFPVPLVTPDPARPGLRALELFHGPTGAFKDFGTRFLMGTLDRMARPGERFTVLVATSGDTGGAAGCAAEGKENVSLAILYPEGRVSAFQEHQLTCWGEGVAAFSVKGDFDACQALVKSAFADGALSRRFNLTSANSINIARLLPQMVYLAGAALDVHKASGVAPGFIIPSGNLGHALAALYARALGAPIGPIVVATNANDALSRWAATGLYQPLPSVATLANAMDIGAPNNFERLAALEPGQRSVSVERVLDDAIRARMSEDFARSGYVWCPHSAIGAESWHRLPEAAREQRVWISAATAHPYKFADIVEPLTGSAIVPSPALEAVLKRRSDKHQIKADPQALARALADTFRPAHAGEGVPA